MRRDSGRTGFPKHRGLKAELRLACGFRKERRQHLPDLRALAFRARGAGVAVFAKGLGVLKVVAAAAAVVLINRHRIPREHRSDRCRNSHGCLQRSGAERRS